MKNIYSTDWFILNFLPCPNCNSKLVPKPVKGEWKNVFCDSCDFACRFVTALNDPNESLLDILPSDLENLLLEKVTLSPLIVHYKWQEENIKWEKVYFFPFVAYRFLMEEQKHPISLLPDKTNSIYFNMFELPNILLYEQPSIEEMADIASHWPQISTSAIQRIFRTGYAKAARIKDIVMVLRRKKGIVDEGVDDSVDDDTDS